jgi:Zn-finger nucleic acid-binding protein
MSRVTELVEEEAVRAEVEAPDDDDDDETDDEELDDDPDEAPEVESVAPFDPKALERELARHERAMAKVLGDGFGAMESCGACGSMGFVPLDFVPAPELRTDPNCVLCGDCAGLGSRLTGSLAPGYEVIACTACQGAGWRDRGQIDALRAAQAYQQPQPVQVVPPQPTYNQSTNQWETAPAAPQPFAPQPTLAGQYPA